MSGAAVFLSPTESLKEVKLQVRLCKQQDFKTCSMIRKHSKF